QRNRLVNRRGDRLAESQISIRILVGRVGLAAYNNDAIETSAHRFDESQNPHRIHRVCFDGAGLRLELVEILQVGLDGIDRTGRASSWSRIDHNRKLVSVHQRVGQVEAPYSEVDYVSIDRERASV